MRFINFGIVIPALGMRGGELGHRPSAKTKGKDKRFPGMNVQFREPDFDFDEPDHESFKFADDDDGLLGFKFENADSASFWDETETLEQIPSSKGKVKEHVVENEDDDEDPFETVLRANGLWNQKRDRPGGILEHSGMSLKLDRVIDQGGNAVIIAATDEGTGINYVVKLGQVTDGNGDDNIEAEYHITSSLQTEGGIIRVYGQLGSMSDRRNRQFKYMVLEKLDTDYGALAEQLLREPLATRVKFVSSFAYYAILTLHKLHQRKGIAHCDIHSKAFLQKNSDKLYRLIDFGKARTVGSHDGETRGCLDRRGNWICHDNIDLLSPYELKDNVCQPRDDLIRLGSILIRAWPSNSIAVGSRTFYAKYEGKKKSKKGSNISKDKVEMMYSWKRGYSLLKHFGSSVEATVSDFPSGAERSESFIDEFYRRVENLAAEEDIPYHELLDLFIAKSDADDYRLTAGEASAITAAYELPGE